MDLESDARAIWNAGVVGVDPYCLLTENLTIESSGHTKTLWVAGLELNLVGVDRILVLGAGKATAAMASGLEKAVGKELSDAEIRIEGLICIPEGTGRPLKWIETAFGRPSGVNEPTIAGVEASRKMLEMVAQTGKTDIVIAMISGGGSALLPLPIEGITLGDKLAVTRHLAASGADIESLNTVRKQLSSIKGGQLAAACNAPVLVTLVLSDVLGDPLTLIASGPTVPDDSTPADAIEILERFDVAKKLPSSVYRVLTERAEKYAEKREARLAAGAGKALHGQSAWEAGGVIREAMVLGNNAVAVDAAGVEAEKRGYRHVMVSSRNSEGEAEELGRHLAEMAISMLVSSKSNDPNCLISGGEPTVKLVPEKERGRGGRNQQLVLSAFCRFLEEPPSIREALKEHLIFLSAGTDGEDGPTDAAGAFLSAGVWEAFEASQMDPRDYLRRNDAYTFFSAVGGLLKTGPTGTNVCDLRIIVCQNTFDRKVLPSRPID